MGLVVFGFFVVIGFSQCVILGLRFSGNNRSFDGYPQRFGTFWGYRKALGHDARKFPPSRRDTPLPSPSARQLQGHHLPPLLPTCPSLKFLHLLSSHLYLQQHQPPLRPTPAPRLFPPTIGYHTFTDTENMNRERAEAHLRLLAEDELRRATMLVPDGTAGSPPEQAMCRASVTETLAGSAALPDAVMASGGARSAGRAGTGLYPVHNRALVRLAAFLVRDTRAAGQVVQDAFAALRHGGPQPGDTGAALAYLRQAVVNRSRLVLRHRSVPGLRRTLVARVARGSGRRGRAG